MAGPEAEITGEDVITHISHMKPEGKFPCIAPMKNDMSTRLRNLRVSRSFHIPPLRPSESDVTPNRLLTTLPYVPAPSSRITL